MTNLPISKFNDDVGLQLGSLLWSWKLCDRCCHAREKPCQSIECASTRFHRATRYFNLYHALLQDYDEASAKKTQVFMTHDDLFHAIKHLDKNPDTTRSDLRSFIASSSVGPEETGMMDATDLVVKVLAMLDCSPISQGPSSIEKGCSGVSWKDDTPFRKYLQDAFPTQNHPVWSSFQIDDEMLVEMKFALRAPKLKKVLRLEFRPTQNIRNHLRLDRRRNELQVFRFASFLKEYLKATKTEDGATVKSAGHLPRQLLLEVLDSTQQILFPLHDAQSRRLLGALVKNHAFDPENLGFESGSLRGLEEENLRYIYFADRLSELYEEIQSPRPRTWLDKQLQRHSSARYMMLATLVGVLFAVLLGIAALVVSAVQTWITYQAWKHPVSQLGM